jgi:hypothetical protein
LQCLSVQCIYCQQIRAKNTSRQKQHLLECPGLRGHPNASQPQAPAPGPNGIGPTNGYSATPNGPTATAPGAGPGPAGGQIGTPSGPMITNGVGTHAATIQTPLQNLQNRPSLPAPGGPQAPGSASAGPLSQPRPQQHTPKPNKPNRQSTSNLPAPPLDDVHAAFVEFRAKEEDKVRRGATRYQPILEMTILTETSVYPCNASTVSRSARRIRVDSDSTCSNARPI